MLKYWSTKSNQHYHVESLSEEEYAMLDLERIVQPNPAIGKTSIFPASKDPFPKHEELESEKPNHELKALLEKYSNPFDIPIEELIKACC